MRENEKMNTQIKQDKAKSYQPRDWKPVIAGGFFTLLSITFIFMAFYTLFNLNTSGTSWFLPVIWQSCIGWISLLFGIPLLLMGFLNNNSIQKERLSLKNKSKVFRLRNLGWIFTIIGGLILAFGIYAAFPYFMVSDQDYFFGGILTLWPFMMFGFPILIIGVWVIIIRRRNEQQVIGVDDKIMSK